MIALPEIILESFGIENIFGLYIVSILSLSSSQNHIWKSFNWKQGLSDVLKLRFAACDQNLA